MISSGMKKRIGTIPVYIAALFAASTHAEEAAFLKLSPDQCVALTQGQKCYVDVTLSWTLPTAGDYCLYSSQQDGALYCWRKKHRGELSKEFVSDKTIKFRLINERNKQLMLSQELKVTWVHQKKGQPRMWWRIF
jgi:hypothetical protein